MSEQGPDIDALTATRTVRFWGQEHTITPVLIDQVFGDGGQVIAFTPLNTRPNWYVIRVDSSWGEDNEDEPSVGDFVDDLYLAVEEEHGNARWCNCDQECDHGECETGYPWPALSDDAGVCWNRLWPEEAL